MKYLWLKMGIPFGSVICLAAALLPMVHSANIVFFFGVSSYSHRVAVWPLAEALAENGHNVSFISPYPAKNPNPKIFDYVPNALKTWLDGIGDAINVFEDRKTMSPLMGNMMLPIYGKMMCEEIYKDEEYIQWVKRTKVDVVMLDALANDCGYGMAFYWDETSWIPGMEIGIGNEMSFSQRTFNAVLPLFWYYYRTWFFFPKLYELTKDNLGITDLPNFEELERSTSLVFINTHYGEEYARSLPPNVVSVGGLGYTGKTKPLPEDIESFLEKGEDFIYMSFGTHAEFNKFDPPIRQAFIGAMRKLSHIQFVWKTDNVSLVEEFPNNNVYIRKWMPQQDILAHPKIRAFITHAGLLGIQEAVYNSVPLISFPIFAEQDANAERIQSREYGIRLEITTVTQPEIEEAIQNILTDPKYLNNMKRVSRMFIDRPQKPLETALWWTDFVIRHSKEDLSVLRPLSVDQSKWKRRQLDVWLTILAGVLISLFVSIYLIRVLVKCAYRVNTSSSKTSKSSTRKQKVK
ncbi:UDP-glucosyltransferase 2-like isoform X2 [Bradysia coprophila]|uniref:UDP-glucosyltransferase 2-like isoform X2 n=1 Tax=Bradysia coprophila TaxID=38358 RepID=UPI00187D80D9|nr:UDP-glucosyltransferase 2-like isoform X2 [Bradysia coprophila]